MFSSFLFAESQLCFLNLSTAQIASAQEYTKSPNRIHSSTNTPAVVKRASKEDVVQQAKNCLNICDTDREGLLSILNGRINGDKKSQCEFRSVYLIDTLLQRIAEYAREEKISVKKVLEQIEEDLEK